MKKLKDYTTEELLLIYFNQSKAPRDNKLVLTDGSVMKMIIGASYGDFLYSNYMYSDSYYSDSDSIDRYSNSSYSNIDYSDSDYHDYLYGEYDSSSGPGGRFYSEYDDYNNSAYDDYSDYGYDNYSDSGYSYSDYNYRQSSRSSGRGYYKDPLHSFWFVVSCLALLMIPIIIFGVALAYNDETSNVTGGWIALCFYASIPFLAVGLPIFIPKMFSHKRYIDYGGYDRDPLSTFSFAASIIILAFGLILFAAAVENIIFPKPESDEAALKPYQLVALLICTSSYLLIGIIMLIYKIKKHKEYKGDYYSDAVTAEEVKEETTTDNNLEEFVIIKDTEEYLESSAYMSTAGIGNRVYFKSLKTGKEIDYAFSDFFEYENKHYLLVSIETKAGKDYDCFEVDVTNNKFYLIVDGARKNAILRVALQRTKDRMKELLGKKK